MWPGWNPDYFESRTPHVRLCTSAHPAETIHFVLSEHTMDLCAHCHKNVYATEKIDALGKVYHTRVLIRLHLVFVVDWVGCLRCFVCDTLLTISSLKSFENLPVSNSSSFGLIRSIARRICPKLSTSIPPTPTTALVWRWSILKYWCRRKRGILSHTTSLQVSPVGSYQRIGMLKCRITWWLARSILISRQNCWDASSHRPSSIIGVRLISSRSDCLSSDA